MPLLTLCADAKCPDNCSCLRYVVDPSSAMVKNRQVRIEASFRSVSLQECKKYIQIKKELYATHF